MDDEQLRSLCLEYVIKAHCPPISAEALIAEAKKLEDYIRGGADAKPGFQP